MAHRSTATTRAEATEAWVERDADASGRGDGWAGAGNFKDREFVEWLSAGSEGGIGIGGDGGASYENCMDLRRACFGAGLEDTVGDPVRQFFPQGTQRHREFRRARGIVLGAIGKRIGATCAVPTDSGFLERNPGLTPWAKICRSAGADLD